MDRTKKKNIRRIVAFGCAAVVVGLLAAMPLLAKQEPEQEGAKASILSGTAENGSILTRLIGGGTLTQADGIAVDLPAQVKLKSFLVGNGDIVTEGTPIASVDRVTVMTSITQVQQTLQTLSEEIEEARTQTGDQTVTALAGGTVKVLYAEEGDTVSDVMLEHGSLAVLSLDGLMAVDLETESSLPVGTAVTVTFEDGETAEGTITASLAGDMTVTLEDEDYNPGTPVDLTAEDGTAIGSGSLYVYSPWNVTAYAGTVDSIKVSLGNKLEAGEELMVLTDVGYSAAYRQLVSRRQAYEELMLELFQMYQTETITAPSDGVVSGVDENSLQLLSDKDSYTFSLLSNSPDGQEQNLYLNYLGQVETVAENGWVLKVDPQALPIGDYLELTNMTVDTKGMTRTVLHTKTDLPVFTLVQDKWTLADRAGVKTGDVLLFAVDKEGGFVWSVLLPQKQSAQQPGGMATPDTPQRPGSSDTPSQPDTPDAPTDSETVTPPSDSQTQPGTPSRPGSSTTPNFSGGDWNGTMQEGGMMGQPQEEEEDPLYAMDMTQIASVTPQSTMTLEITVDEQDVTALQVGMEARLRVDALGGEKYTATISHIGNTGTNNGGSSKYTVTLTLDRAENMLAGMTATATVQIAATEDVLTVPAAALVEEGNRTVIYTGYNEETDTLLNPVTVTVGVSDGESVEILEGLTQGQTYYYAYYDTLEVSYTPDFGSGGLFGR